MLLTSAKASEILSEASIVAGLDPTGASLIRLGSNAVFQFSSVPVIARIAQGADSPETVHRQLSVARWLADMKIPAIREWPLSSDVEQPVVIQGFAVVFWESVNSETRYGSTRELGGILRRLHALEAPRDFTLPSQNVFGRTVERLTRAGQLDDAAHGFLASRVDALKDTYRRLHWLLPRGPIHDDANVGNLLRDRSG
jgi:Ser/Thr protein kinase RdoA (MazF antagonist)